MKFVYCVLLIGFFVGLFTLCSQIFAVFLLTAKENSKNPKVVPYRTLVTLCLLFWGFLCRPACSVSNWFIPLFGVFPFLKSTAVIAEFFLRQMKKITKEYAESWGGPTTNWKAFEDCEKMYKEIRQ